MGKAAEKCPVCGHKPSEFWQCSHPECPARKPVTADAPAHTGGGRVPPRINDDH